MAQIITIKIQHPSIEGGYIKINADQFDPMKHKRFEEAVSLAPAAPAPEPVKDKKKK